MIHVLIERRIADGMLSTYEELARKAMQRTYKATGFLSAEGLIDTYDPNHRFILCKWRSELDWQRWSTSAERQEFTNQIAAILEEPERVTILQH